MSLEQIQVELQDWMGSDRKIAEAAWTSSTSLQEQEIKTDEDVERLVKMMASSGHGTPFESVVMRFWIRMPIFTDRQHMTHRVATHNGLSGRYRTLPNDFYTIPNDVSTILKKTPLGYPHHKRELERYQLTCQNAYHLYNTHIDILKDSQKDGRITNDEYKRAREVIRGVLPVAGMVERVSIFNLRSFANYMRHRLSSHAQLEIQQVAKLMLQRVKNKGIAPIAVGELERRDWLLEPDLPK